MKKALLLSLMIVCTASLAFGQAGQVGVFSDATGTDCNLPAPGGNALVFLAVVHINHGGATAVQFSAPLPACSAGFLVYLADQALFPVTVGNSQTGVAIGYGACLAAPVNVMNIQVLSTIAGGSATPCCLYPTLPDPNLPSGEVEVVDCQNNLIFGKGYIGVLNGNSTCTCAQVPTSENTWGGVKALYQ